MAGDRDQAIATAIGRLASADNVPVRLEHVCRAGAAALGVAGVSLCTIGDLGLGEPVYATDAVSERAIELEITVGTGPGMQALRNGNVVMSADLDSSTSLHQWPALVPMLSALGVCAVFAFPLTAGEITVGVLELYRAGPGALPMAAMADGQLFADYAMALLLDSDYWRPGSDVEDVLAGTLPEQWRRVNLATCVIAAQLGIGATQAYQRLRAYAFTVDCQLRQVADAVLEGCIELTP
ncbi:GAF and ANTAR domain-containing protein [Kutzneria buriramensis]|uniref:ANTAR domain-containing protein n=1 Tax=Kutzneria buriramensis TaxID=1045776 RepID=A0A3E0HI20_9PSEU|nr:GAF and ANTAR domain-containing protein [Kutzneria buriramensis]REH46087.1 ANTAR domain-containing protein [Kutzneria buriramensis]